MPKGLEFEAFWVVLPKRDILVEAARDKVFGYVKAMGGKRRTRRRILLPLPLQARIVFGDTRY